MKLSLVSLAAIAIIPAIAFSDPLLAHTHSPQTRTYPAKSRATFLSGCILDPDNAPDFSNRQEVADRVEACVCLLDRFQQDYSHDRFIELFSALASSDRLVAYQARKEIGDFFRNNVPDCVPQREN